MTGSLPWSAPIDWAQPNNQEIIFLVVRHGETEGNISRIMTGCSVDHPLNPHGHEQASRVAKKIAALQKEGKLKISALYSSRMTRAIETARHFSEALELPFEQRADLREIFWGDAEGIHATAMHEKTKAEEARLLEEIPDRKTRWDYLPAIPHAEKFNAILKRVHAEFDSIGAVHQGKIVLVVTHGRVVRTLVADALDIEAKDSPFPENCGVTVFRYTLDGGLQFIEVRENK